MRYTIFSMQYRRSAVGLMVLGALLSFALGQQVGHGHGRTPTLNVAGALSVPAVSARTSGDIGIVVAPRTSPSTRLLAANTTTTHQQSAQTSQKHGHEHGKGTALVTLVTLYHSAGDGQHHHDGGNGD